jgi:tetratricopeptide (TPR) repeat protein
VPVLSQIFPGLRDFRTPFASGLLWLLVTWILVEPHVNTARPHGVYASVRTLNHVLQPLGIGASLALLAYLVGAVMEILWSPPLQRISLVGKSGVAAISAVVTRRLDDLSDEETIVFGLCHSFSARTYIADLEHRSSAQDLELNNIRAMGKTRHVVEGVAREIQNDMVMTVRNELDLAATRLLGDKQGQFEIYDRLRSEAEFRIAIAVPVGILTYLLTYHAVTRGTAICLGIAIGGVLVVQARNRRRAAGDRMADFLLVGDVVAPSLDQLKSGRFTFEALEAGTVRLPRATVSDRGARYGGGNEETVFGVPLRARLRQAVISAGDLTFDALERIWRYIRRAAGFPVRGGRALGFAVRDLVLNRGRVLMRVASLRQARRAGDPKAQVALGDAYRDAGYYKRAAAAYQSLPGYTVAIERIIDLDLEIAYRSTIRSGGVRFLRDLVELYAEQGRLETARRACSLAIDQHHIEANIPLGDVLRALGRRQDAEQAYSTAIAAGFLAASVPLAQLLLRGGRATEARGALERAVDAGVNSALVPLGDLLRKEGRNDEAHSLYRRAEEAGISVRTES